MLTEGPAVQGSVSLWHRNGRWQAVLAGHPLYTYVIDTKPQMATGQGAHGYGRNWYVIKASGSGGSSGDGSCGGGWGRFANV